MHSIFIYDAKSHSHKKADFGSDTERLQVHRMPWEPKNPGQQVVVPMYHFLKSTVMIYLTAYCAITGIIVGTASSVSFSPVWMVFIIWIACIPVIAGLFNAQIRGSHRGGMVMHRKWLEDLTPGVECALPRDIKAFMHINYGVVQTSIRIVLGSGFFVLGILYRRHRDARVMTVLGIMWLLELVVRWATELAYGYYWGLKHSDSHLLVQEYIGESRLTRWCRRYLGWPKDPNVGGDDFVVWPNPQNSHDP